MRMLWQKSRFYDIIILQLNRDRERIAKDRPVLFYFSFLPQICPTNPRDAYKTREYFYYNKLTTKNGRKGTNCPKVSILHGKTTFFVRFCPSQNLPQICPWMKFLPQNCPTKRQPTLLNGLSYYSPSKLSLMSYFLPHKIMVLWGKIIRYFVSLRCMVLTIPATLFDNYRTFSKPLLHTDEGHV